MSDPVSFTEAKWQKQRDTRNLTVADALRVCLAQVERGEIQAHHVVIALGHVTEDNAAGTDWFQAGSFSPYEQIGLIERVKMAIIQTAEPL